MTSATEPDLRHVGSLITLGDKQCLGYLMHFDGHGIYEANLGRIEISKRDADTHNRLLDDALLKGIDENCDVGMGGTFYWGHSGSTIIVKTFLGQQVSDRATLHGVVLTFHRKGKTFRGRVQKDAECFNFKRIV